MEKEYIRGNKEHWEEIYKYVCGCASKLINSDIWSDDKVLLVKIDGKFSTITDPIVYDAITTNPNWHEIKPWLDNWKPKPFDKVLGWYDEESEAEPDIFHLKIADDYICAKRIFKYVKPYDEEEYTRLIQKTK